MYRIDMREVIKYTNQTTNIYNYYNIRNTTNIYNYYNIRNMFPIFQPMSKEQAAKRELKVDLNKLKLTEKSRNVEENSRMIDFGCLAEGCKQY